MIKKTQRQMTERTKKKWKVLLWQPESTLNISGSPIVASSSSRFCNKHFRLNQSVSVNAGCARWQPLFLNSTVRERPCTQFISHSSICMWVSSQTQVHMLMWALCMKKHLCCDCEVMLEGRRGRWGRVGGEVFVESQLAFPDKCGALPEPPQWQ